jgi:hypothetical protein
VNDEPTTANEAQDQDGDVVLVELDAYGREVGRIPAESERAAIEWSHDPRVWTRL